MSKEIGEDVKGTILVVDDMPQNLRFLAQILPQHGYAVRPAINGQIAIASAQNNPPDLILLDIMMPDLNGYEVCTRLKADPRTQHIPVIFLTALSETVDKLKAFAAGGVDYVTKPFQIEEVLARVATHITLRNLQRSLEAENRRYQKAQADLQEMNATLEARVSARTIELEAANHQLSAEIVERQKTQRALEDSLTEIQRLKDQLEHENLYLRQEINQEYNVAQIIGHSEALKYVLFRVRQVAPTSTTVLIQGETGTGKELFARAVHQQSTRRDRPLVKVNCAALPPHLIESELFGHEKGAFTGALTRQIGRFEFADGATLFLDEIGELPLELQAKLLRVLQDGEFERLGSPRTMKADVRLIAATNRDLEEEVRAGRFRLDLFYRLNIYPISLPPLRERRDDIPLLVQVFVQRIGKKLGKPIDRIPQKTMAALQAYAWPGNIRELENLIERAIITTPDAMLRVELPEPAPRKMTEHQTLEAVEREHILRILDEAKWKINGPQGAAVRLNLHPNTLRFRMRKLGIHRPQ